MRVTVIGAGVAGLTSALALAEHGCSVEVLDRSASLGAGACSYLAGGMLAPWCERESAEELVVELGCEALDYWPVVHPDTARRGSLVLASRRDEPDLARFTRRTSGHHSLDAVGIAALEPDLDGRFTRGLYFADEAHLDPRAAMVALADRLDRLGVPIRCGIEADEVSGPVVDCPGSQLATGCRICAV